MMPEDPNQNAAFVLVMAKHLPPSAASLLLADAGGGAGPILTSLRADLEVTAVSGASGLLDLPAASTDAVTWLGPLSGDLMQAALRALRPGGRFIAVDPAGSPSPERVTNLEGAGFVRILVEPALLEPEPAGVLMRGECPHPTADTLARIDSVSARDAGTTDWSAFRGRYVHLLVRVLPDKPAWKLAPGEVVEWRAIALERDSGPTLLAFSSLPIAVAFLQRAVLAGAIEGVNKIARFPRASAEAWTVPLVFNASYDSVAGSTLTRITVDHGEAITGEE